jgi:transcription antitermination factor NusG
MQWNVNIQREIMANTVFTVGYVGSHNLHLNNQKDFNYPVPFTGPTGLPTFGVYSPTANAVIANPRLNPSYGYLQMIDALGTSHYESLQASLNRRFSNGFEYLVTYSFSKSIDDSSGSYGLDGGGAVYNPTSATADTGFSNFNREHNFRVSAIYDVPAKARGLLGGVVNGWQLTGIYTYLSGAPFSVGTIANRVDNATGANAARPNAVAGCDLYSGYQTLNDWFNPNCFTAPAVGTYGNAGRDAIIGPNLWGMDGSLSKSWSVSKISEAFRIQFRAEAFNLLNHPTFVNPGAAQAAVFNAALSTAVATNPFAGVAPNATVGKITATTSTPRQVQLGLNKEVELPLFPGYLFCRLDPRDRLLPIWTTPGVIGIVGPGKIPLPVAKEEIEAVRSILGSGLTAQPWPFLGLGTRVYIEYGPLRGLEGVITSTDKVHRLVVSVELLQRSVAVEINSNWARPISNPIAFASERAETRFAGLPQRLPNRASLASSHLSLLH